MTGRPGGVDSSCVALVSTEPASLHILLVQYHTISIDPRYPCTALDQHPFCFTYVSGGIVKADMEAPSPKLHAPPNMFRLHILGAVLHIQHR